MTFEEFVLDRYNIDLSDVETFDEFDTLMFTKAGAVGDDVVEEYRQYCDDEEVAVSDVPDYISL